MRFVPQCWRREQRLDRFSVAYNQPSRHHAQPPSAGAHVVVAEQTQDLDPGSGVVRVNLHSEGAAHVFHS